MFSFKHVSITEKFTPEGRDGRYLVKLVERLKALCGIGSTALRAATHRSIRCHPIDFAGTTEPEGFVELPGPLKREGVDPFQFEISVNEYGRVHGFFVGEIFYVVWIDPDHKLYAR